MIVSACLGGLWLLMLYIYEFLVLKPKRLRSKLGKQGLRGPSSSILFGNIPDMKSIKRKAMEKSSATESMDHHLVNLGFNFLISFFSPRRKIYNVQEDLQGKKY